MGLTEKIEAKRAFRYLLLVGSRRYLRHLILLKDFLQIELQLKVRPIFPEA